MTAIKKITFLSALMALIIGCTPLGLKITRDVIQGEADVIESVIDDLTPPPPPPPPNPRPLRHPKSGVKICSYQF